MLFNNSFKFPRISCLVPYLVPPCMFISITQFWLGCVPIFCIFLHSMLCGSWSYHLQHSVIICLYVSQMTINTSSEKTRAYSFLNPLFLSQGLADSKLLRDVHYIELKWLSLGFNSKNTHCLSNLLRREAFISCSFISWPWSGLVFMQ